MYEAVDFEGNTIHVFYSLIELKANLSLVDYSETNLRIFNPDGSVSIALRGKLTRIVPTGISNSGKKTLDTTQSL